MVAIVGAAIALVACGPLDSSPSDPVPAAKQVLLDQEKAAQRASAGTAIQKPSQLLPQGTPYPIPPREGGLLHDVGQGPFGATEFHATDVWQGAVNGTWIQVYAGTDLTGSHPVGALRLYSMPIDPNVNPTAMTDLGTFMPPVAETSLAISSAKGTTLTLTAPSGDRFTFDVATRVILRN